MALRAYQIESSSHTHDFAQLVLPIIGSMEIEVGSQFSVVNDNTGVYIAPNERHCFAGSQDNLFLVVDIGAEDDLLSKKSMPHLLNLTTTAKKFVHFVHDYLVHNQRDFYTDSLVNQLLLTLSSTTVLSEPDQKIVKAKNWINLHFAVPIDVDRVARHCHLSTSQLQRRFKQNTGYGIAEYWRIKKMQHAKYLLSLSHSTIEEIAYKIGYENLSAFSRRFRQVFGVSPSEWRNIALTAKKMRVIDN